MRKTLERFMEPLLWQSRFIIVLAVIASLAGSLILVLVGVGDVALIFYKAREAFADAEAYNHFEKLAVGNIIAAVDVFLIATVLLIFGIGLYELFISRIDLEEPSDHHARKVLGVKDLDDLKERLAKVLVMALVVAFFKLALGLKITTPLELLLMGAAILAAALALMVSKKSGKSAD